MTPNLRALRQRAELLRELRHFLDTREFLEVQPPCLASDRVVDAYLDSLSIPSRQFGIGNVDLPETFYLQTSPESAMKRMLAAGAPSIYSLGPVFRAGERGDYHNTEFTMLEWYDVGADMAAGVRLLGEMAIEMLHRDAYDVRSYRQVFRDRLGLDPIDSKVGELHRLTTSLDKGLAATIAEDRDSMLDLIMSKLIQPELGIDRPLILTSYPLTQAALAKVDADDPQCAARFELFANGIELANGYDELRDPDVLSTRYRDQNAKRVASGRSPMPVDTTLMTSMREGLPACAGVALGVDRLLMIRQSTDRIDEVIPLTIERA